MQVPDILQQLLSRHHFAVVLRKIHQQIKFLWRHRNILAPNMGRACFGPDFQIGKGHQIVVHHHHRLTPQQSPYPRYSGRNQRNLFAPEHKTHVCRGGEQSGFISSIGFETYNNILNEAIKELKNNDFKELYEDQEESLSFVDDCQIDTDFELLIPATYVQNISERLQLYHQLNACSSLEDLDVFRKELLDRFGRLPKSTEELINSLPIKWMARDLGFQKLVMKSGKMVAHFILNQDSDYFKSDIFQHILVQVQSLAPHVSLKQKNDKLSLVFQKITSIEKAKQILTKLQPKIQVEA